MKNRIDKVGIFSKAKIVALKPLLNKHKIIIKNNTRILIGTSNINHMKKEHPSDYKKYGKYIREIIKNPDYLGVHKSKREVSIEFIKEFKIDNEYVKIAVRVSNKGTYYARTMYVINNKRVSNFIAKGDLVKFEK